MHRVTALQTLLANKSDKRATFHEQIMGEGIEEARGQETLPD
jgi:hypothetical protein